jgi:hypothetical protein
MTGGTNGWERGPVTDVAPNRSYLPKVFLPGDVAPPSAPVMDDDWATKSYVQTLQAPPVSVPPPVRPRKGLWIGLTTVGVVAVGLGLAYATGVITVARQHSESTVADPSAATGVSFQSPDGHFDAKFPSDPRTYTTPVSVGGVTLSVFAAAAGDPLTEVTEEQVLSDSVPPSDFDHTLRVSVSSFAAGASATVNSQRATTFRGFTARTATITMSTGAHVTMTVFIESGTSVFVLLAASGAPYDNLVKSFELVT